MDKEVIVVKKSFLTELSETYLKAVAATAGVLSVFVIYAYVGSNDTNNKDQKPNKTKK